MQTGLLKISLLLALFTGLFGCGGDGGDDNSTVPDEAVTDLAQTQPASQTQCGDVSTQINEGETEEEAVERLSSELLRLGYSSEGVSVLGRTVIIVACGGTLISDSSTSQVTNESPSEEESD